MLPVLRYAAGGRYEKVTDGLRITNITLNDNGEYTCRAEVETDGRYDERKINVAVHSKCQRHAQSGWGGGLTGFTL